MRVQNRLVRAGLIAAAVGLFAAGTLFGQTSTLNGRVANNKGGVVSGADVLLLNLPMAPMPNMPNMRASTTPVKTARSAANGAFSLTEVPAGQYVLQVDAAGFER